VAGKNEMPKEFWDWFNEKLNTRSLSDRRLAEMAGLSNSVISRARTGSQAMGWDALVAVADALQTPREEVLRLAGLLLRLPTHDPEVEELVHLFRQLKGDDRRDMLDLAVAKLARVKRGERGEKETRRR